jgi:hypothetical protein
MLFPCHIADFPTEWVIVDGSEDHDKVIDDDGVGSTRIVPVVPCDVVGIGNKAVSDRGLKRGRSDDSDVGTGLEEEEETPRGYDPTADEEHTAVLELIGDEEGSAFDDGRVLNC